MTPTTAVAILNWNGLHHLKAFLAKVYEYSRDDAEVWVIDNNSSDDSVNYIKEHHPEVKLVLLDHNYGFADGYNEGLKQIDAKYFVLLNSDVEVTPNWIKPVINFIESDNKLVAAQPKILDYRNRDQFEHAGAAGGFIDSNAYPFCAGRIMDTFEKDHGQYEENREVFWASGAALFIEADRYKEVGGLDGEFFAHMEEIDLCWRLKNRSYKIGACGSSMVYHVGGGTLNKLDPKKTYLNFRNNLFLITKNDFIGIFPLKLIRRMILDGVASIRFLSEGKWAFFKAVLKAHSSYYRHFRRMYSKRLSLKNDLHNPNLHGIYRGSILIEYFLKKRTKFTELPKNLFR